MIMVKSAQTAKTVVVDRFVNTTKVDRGAKSVVAAAFANMENAEIFAYTADQGIVSTRDNVTVVRSALALVFANICVGEQNAKSALALVSANT